VLKTQFGESPIVRIDLDRLTIEKHGTGLAVNLIVARRPGAH
jgi:hypothetical protein